ncbi:hypothetical protein D9757_005968 [Collybiopsis confluens]|uniref:Hydrophobin n=1 Tax=Collybiopsis confluens TaxID=2823264 RepID=A0A8H5HUK2_9AGAR|nr:hypothetical protein D9757_005968 [Collybiopsis confluens]
MLSTLATTTIIALATLVVATPSPSTISSRQTSFASCSTGSLLCCNVVRSASDPSTSALLGLLGIVIPDSSVIIGITCAPISLIEFNPCAGGQIVCCEDNSHGGLVAISCVPATL